MWLWHLFLYDTYYVTPREHTMCPRGGKGVDPLPYRIDGEVRPGGGTSRVPPPARQPRTYEPLPAGAGP